MKHILGLAFIALTLTACGSTREDLGLERKDFNATRAEEQKQLLLPPNYDLLPSAEQPQTQPRK